MTNIPDGQNFFRKKIEFEMGKSLAMCG